MKRKIVAVFLVLSLCYAGIAYAAGVWGTYKGNNIIRLTVDGAPVKVTDVPAISYNGRTMIPIYLLQQAGIKYTWDNKNQTVDIVKSLSPSNDADPQTRIQHIKDLSAAADYYYQLSNLGEMIKGLSADFGLTFNAIDRGDNGRLQKSLDRLNDIIDSYNDFIEHTEKTKDSLSRSNISIDNAKTVLDYYFKALDYYKESYWGLEAFSGVQNDTNFDKYLDNEATGFDTAFDGLEIAADEYHKFMELVQAR